MLFGENYIVLWFLSPNYKSLIERFSNTTQMQFLVCRRQKDVGSLACNFELI